MLDNIKHQNKVERRNVQLHLPDRLVHDKPAGKLLLDARPRKIRNLDPLARQPKLASGQIHEQTHRTPYVQQARSSRQSNTPEVIAADIQHALGLLIVILVIAGIIAAAIVEILLGVIPVDFLRRRRRIRKLVTALGALVLPVLARTTGFAQKPDIVRRRTATGATPDPGIIS